MAAQEPIVVYVDPDLADLIPRFLANQQTALATMQAALQQHDYETIRHAGHKMKGSAGGYGFDALSDLGATLEQGAQVGDHATLASCLASLEHHLQHVEIRYEA
jgi:HPt (histidine-containing phosphotransfer) domain-containing protein